MIDIRNFVNINIQPSKITSVSGTRPKVMVFGDANAENDIVITGANSNYDTFYNGTTEVKLSGDELTYAQIFFKNGGSYLTFTSKTADALFVDDNKKSLEDTIIFVKYSKDGETSLVDTSKEEGNFGNFDDWTTKGIYEKILIYRMTSASIGADTFKNATAQNVCVKVSDKLGYEMTIAGYLSHIDCYKADSIADYDFTQEYGVEEDLSDTLTSEVKDGESLQDIHYNFEMLVGGNYLNIGGNAIGSNGYHKSFSIVERYVTIILTQNLTEAVFNALSTKISGDRGLGTIRTAMCAELDRYVESGFLITDKVWMNDDLVMANAVDSTLPNETIITKNTPISNGYWVHIFRLSKDDRKAYAFVILTTRKGIRYVKVDGWTL